ARSETNERGRTVSTTATVDEDGLMVTYLGQRSNDFYLTIVPIDKGRIRVTRRVFLDDSNEGITVNSVYDKTSNIALFETITLPSGSTTIGNSAAVPVGTRLDAELRSVVSSSPASDRFSLEVTSPGQFRRAVINGRVLLEDPRSRAAGRVRALLAFDTITLQDGRTYKFNAKILTLTTADGESLEVTNQAASPAAAQPRNVGGVLGALIGAIAGVPVNPNAGSAAQGSIVSQRGDSLYLNAGSQITLTVSEL
ncbi:MAG: hypothetical protein PSX80_04065, partial [bacterium]|nr:hypothetical protein [bacterium]